MHTHPPHSFVLTPKHRPLALQHQISRHCLLPLLALPEITNNDGSLTSPSKCTQKTLFRLTFYVIFDALYKMKDHYKLKHKYPIIDAVVKEALEFTTALVFSKKLPSLFHSSSTHTISLSCHSKAHMYTNAVCYRLCAHTTTANSGYLHKRFPHQLLVDMLKRSGSTPQI